jgi:hypothetical protein
VQRELDDARRVATGRGGGTIGEEKGSAKAGALPSVLGRESIGGDEVGAGWLWVRAATGRAPGEGSREWSASWERPARVSSADWWRLRGERRGDAEDSSRRRAMCDT